MNKTLTIYHGSKEIVDNPKYGKGKPYNDYGLGFYCTESLELAKEWSVTDKNDGYANIYELDTSKLNILYLTRDYNVLYWITILVQNRKFNPSTSIAKNGKAFLINNYCLPISNYDVIIGYRADDSYFSFAQAFLNNSLSIKKLEKALKLGGLGKQVVLISKKAFDCIKFTGYEEADSKIHYQKRLDRNEFARDKYNSINNKVDNDDIFLIDLIRGEKHYDESIR